MFLSDVLRSGFTLVHRRPGLVLLDILWKFIWIAVTLGTLALAVLWLTADLRAIQWDDAGGRALNLLVAGALLREFWSAHKGEMFATAGVLLAASGILWILLEAFFRRKMVRDVCVECAGGATYPYRVFLASGMLKSACVSASGAVLAIVFLAGAPLIAIVVFLCLCYFLTLVETLIRADAVELFGTDLIRAAGLLGILLSFEAAAAASLGLILIAGFQSAARPIDAVVMMGSAAAGAVLLNILHGYLLLVRFSAIAIMRRNAVEV